MLHNPFLKIKYILFAIIFVCLCHFAVKAQIKAIPAWYPIIPYPADLVPENGDFIINQKLLWSFKMKTSARMRVL
jgi:hypothetical protein